MSSMNNQSLRSNRMIISIVIIIAIASLCTANASFMQSSPYYATIPSTSNVVNSFAMRSMDVNSVGTIVLSNFDMSVYNNNIAVTGCSSVELIWSIEEPYSGVRDYFRLYFAGVKLGGNYCYLNTTYGYTIDIPVGAPITTSDGGEVYVVVTKADAASANDPTTILAKAQYTINYNNATQSITFRNINTDGRFGIVQPVIDFPFTSQPTTLSTIQNAVNFDSRQSPPWPYRLYSTNRHNPVVEFTNYAFATLIVTRQQQQQSAGDGGFDEQTLGEYLGATIASDVFDLVVVSNPMPTDSGLVTFGFYVVTSPYASQSASMRLLKYNTTSLIWEDMNASLLNGVLGASVFPLRGQYVIVIPSSASVPSSLTGALLSYAGITDRSWQWYDTLLLTLWLLFIFTILALFVVYRPTKWKLIDVRDYYRQYVTQRKLNYKNALARTSELPKLLPALSPSSLPSSPS